MDYITRTLWCPRLGGNDKLCCDIPHDSCSMEEKEMHSMELINIHLWLSSIGIVLYITSMWAAGIMQGLMWRSYDEMGF